MSTTSADELVEASIVAAHAYEVGLHVRTGLGDPKVWVISEKATDLDASLPVCIFSDYLAALRPDVPRVQRRALANLLQLTLEIERDGDEVQRVLELYHSRGLLTGPCDYGIAYSEAAFLAVGEQLAARTCASPFKTGPADWQVALVKVQHWSMKLRGQNRVAEMAAEILRRDDFQPLLPRLRSLPAQRIMVVGHSFTLARHWSTLAPMNEMAAEAFRQVNPGVVFGHRGHGGMSASVARATYLESALAWQPDRVMVAALYHGEKDYQALADMVAAFQAQGADTFCLDQLHPEPTFWLNPDGARLAAIAGQASLTVIPVGARIMQHPDRADFVSLDGVHMRTSYHRFLAVELLRFLTDPRKNT